MELVCQHRTRTHTPVAWMPQGRRAVAFLLCFLGIPPAGAIRGSTSGTKAVAFIFDYDLCFDIVAIELLRGEVSNFGGEKMEETTPGSDAWWAKNVGRLQVRTDLVQQFVAFVEEKSKGMDKSLFFLGGSRQDGLTDNLYANTFGNGSARRALEAFVRHFGDGTWEVKKGLLGDYELGEGEQAHYRGEGVAWADESSQLTDPNLHLYNEAAQADLKRLVLRYHMRVASEMFETVEAYYFDDNWFYLQNIRDNARPPKDYNVKLNLVWWDWRTLATGRGMSGRIPPRWRKGNNTHVLQADRKSVV